MGESYIQALQVKALVDNRTIKLSDILKEALTSGSYPKIDITVGFLFLSGLKEIKEELKQFFSSGGEMRIVMGNVMQDKTYEQLVLAHNSLEKVKIIQKKNIFSNNEREEVSQNADVYGRQIGYMSHDQENEEMVQLLKQWLESGRLKLRVYTKEYMHAKTYIFHASGSSISFGLVGSSNMSLSGLMANTELNAPVAFGHYKTLSEWFEGIWKEAEDFNPALIEVIESSWANPEFLPPPYEVFIRGLYELFRDIIEAEERGLYITRLFSNLYRFQIDAAKRAITIANRYGGVMISDVVGLGKTYIACATAHDLALRNFYSGKPSEIAVIAPKQLVSYWKSMFAAFNIEGRVFSAGLLSVDEARSENKRKMMDYVRDKAGVVIVDEAHKYTNPERMGYSTLKKILVGKKALMLTATPYRKRYGDIIRIIQLFIHDPKPPFPVSARSWSELTEMIEEGRIPASYVLREVMVRRTRYDIIRLYGSGKGNCIEFGDQALCFPERHLKTLTYSISDVYELDVKSDALNRLAKGRERAKDVYKPLVEGIRNMTYARFNLYSYVLPKWRKKKPYSELSQAGNLKGITKMLFLKRLESSWYAFYRTVERSLIISKNFLKFLEQGVVPAGEDFEEILLNLQEGEPRELTPLEVKQRIEKADVKYEASKFDEEKLVKDVSRDIEILEDMLELIKPLKKMVEKDPEKDDKLNTLIGLLRRLMSKEGQKVVIFSEYSETVEWLFNAFKKLGLTERWRVAAITSRTKNIAEKVKRFAPKANNYATDEPLDILIATDVLSEGLNLQDANVVVNYDLHWTPVKLIQRIGRVDRIGSEHDRIYVYNFFPETKLESKLGLIEKVRKRVEEFGKALGADGKILEESEEWNPSAIKAIYGEEADILKDIDIKDPFSVAEGAEVILRKFMKEHPDRFEKIKKRYSMRSVCSWNGDMPLALFVCTNGVKTNYYIFRYENGSWKQYMDKDLEMLYRDVGLSLETPSAKFNAELYYGAAKEALRTFREMIEETGSKVVLGGKRRTKAKNLQRLYDIVIRVEAERKRELEKLFDLVHWGARNVEPFNRDLRKIRVEDDEKFIEAVKRLVVGYNISEMMNNYKKRLEESGKKAFEPHIVAGLLFLPRKDYDLNGHDNS